MENNNNLSLNKIDIRYLMKEKEIKKQAKVFNILSNVTKLVVGAGIGAIAILSHLELLTPVILGLSGTTLGLLGIGIMLGNAQAKNNKKKCDEVLERVKLIAQQQCSERLINGQTFKVVRSNNVESNLKNYSFEQQIIYSEGEKIVEHVERDDLQVGTVSRQYVLSDDENVIGAIEEIKTNDIERKPTEKGSSECVVSTYGYKWVGPSEIRPYDTDKCITKSMKK